MISTVIHPLLSIHFLASSQFHPANCLLNRWSIYPYSSIIHPLSSTHPTMHPFTSICSSIDPSIYWDLATSPLSHPSIHSSVHLSAYLYQSTWPLNDPWIHASIHCCPTTCPFSHLVHSTTLSIQPSFYPSMYAYPSICKASHSTIHSYSSPVHSFIYWYLFWSLSRQSSFK